MKKADFMPQATVRKTVSFPRQLAKRIADQARADRRKFSPQVVKTIEDIFASQTVRQSRAAKQESAR
jgi:hypothetical protein